VGVRGVGLNRFGEQVIKEFRHGGGQKLVVALPQFVCRPLVALDQPGLLVLGGLEGDLWGGGRCTADKDVFDAGPTFAALSWRSARDRRRGRKVGEPGSVRPACLVSWTYRHEVRCCAVALGPWAWS
jgi:hypothetical protein